MGALKCVPEDVCPNLSHDYGGSRRFVAENVCAKMCARKWGPRNWGFGGPEMCTGECVPHKVRRKLYAQRWGPRMWGTNVCAGKCVRRNGGPKTRARKSVPQILCPKRPVPQSGCLNGVSTNVRTNICAREYLHKTIAAHLYARLAAAGRGGSCSPCPLCGMCCGQAGS